MDLGIKGRSALVCASSRGLGRACATALARAGARVVINGQDADRLKRVAEELHRDTGSEIIAVAGNVSNPADRERLVAALPHVDILVNNNGGPPARDFRTIDHDDMIAGLEANMIAPVDMIRRVIDGMVERGFGRIVNITSVSVKMPLAGLDLSSGARAGLTGFSGGIARSVAHANVTINALLPGSFDTDRITALDQAAADRTGDSVAETRRKREAAIPAGRLGRPEEFGAACAFLCSDFAGYITGQSIVIDGGVYPGIL